MKTRLITLFRIRIAVLAATCAVMAQEISGDEIIITTKDSDIVRTNLSQSNWRYDIGRHDGVARKRHKDIKLPITYSKNRNRAGVTEVDLSGNLLTNFTVPPGMVSLSIINLRDNPKLESVFLQQCTSSSRSELQVEPKPGCYYCSRYITIRIDDKVPLRRISAPMWIKGGIHLDGVSWKQLHDIDWVWRDNEIEIVRWHLYGYKNSVVCWGTGIIQFAKSINGEWEDWFRSDFNNYFQYRLLQRYPISSDKDSGMLFFRIKPEPTLGDIPSVVIDE